MIPLDRRRRALRPVAGSAVAAKTAPTDGPIAELDKLPLRVVNVLEKHDIIVVSALLRLTYDQLITMPNFGDKTIRELRAVLVAAGYKPPSWTKPKGAAPRREVRSVGFFSFE